MLHSREWFGEFMEKHAPQPKVEMEVIRTKEEIRRHKLGIDDHDDNCLCAICFPPDFDDLGD